MAKEMDQEEYENRISELELQIEEMERTDSVLYGVAFCFLNQIIWHSWLVSFGIGVCISLIYWKFLAKKPFSNGITTVENSK